MTAMIRIALACLAGTLVATTAQAQDDPAEAPSKQSVITSQDYPRRAIDMHEEGTVKYHLTIGTDGQVKDCTVTTSSGYRDLDRLTCRLVQQRFVYRPSTDRYGRPIRDEVEGEHEWVARGR